MKIILRKPTEIISLLLLLVVTTSGCCTGTLVKRSKQKTVDAFYPSVVYEISNANNYALEGNIHANDPRFSSTTRGSKPPIHAYLITPMTNFAAPYFTDNGVFMLPEKRPDLTKHLRVEYQPPQNLKKIADLPEDYAGLKIKEHHTNRWMLIFLPFSVAVDVATAPIQIPLLVLFNSGSGHGP